MKDNKYLHGWYHWNKNPWLYLLYVNNTYVMFFRNDVRDLRGAIVTMNSNNLPSSIASIEAIKDTDSLSSAGMFYRCLPYPFSIDDINEELIHYKDIEYKRSDIELIKNDKSYLEIL